MLKFHTAALAAVLAVPALASAQNLITNGGFESFSSDGYSADGWNLAGGETCGQAHTGVRSACLTETLPFLYGANASQLLRTAAGQTYTIDFWSALTPFRVGSSAVDVW